MGGRGQPSRFMIQPMTPKNSSENRSPQSCEPSNAATNTSATMIGSRISGRMRDTIASQRLQLRQMTAPITCARVRLQMIV